MNTVKRAALVTMVAASGVLIATTGAAAHQADLSSASAAIVTDQNGELGQQGELGASTNDQTGDQGATQTGQSGDQGASQMGQSGDPGGTQTGQTGDTGQTGQLGASTNDQTGDQGQSGDSGSHGA